jgi:hypothetical protein
MQGDFRFQGGAKAPEAGVPSMPRGSEERTEDREGHAPTDNPKEIDKGQSHEADTAVGPPKGLPVLFSGELEQLRQGGARPRNPKGNAEGLRNEADTAVGPPKRTPGVVFRRTAKRLRPPTPVASACRGSESGAKAPSERRGSRSPEEMHRGGAPSGAPTSAAGKADRRPDEQSEEGGASPYQFSASRQKCACGWAQAGQAFGAAGPSWM